ncbi:LapA family protein [Planktotalea sp.]|uniref:LapA family protein n=1 Tax=Planktotalea sp. TaxID=2029877 RepID=UPI003296C172
MRYIKYFVLAVIAVVLISIALGNRQMVTLELMHSDLAALANDLGFTFLTGSIDLPLFVVVFGGVALGLLIGFIWEWIREYKERAAAAAQKREMDRMRREIKRLKADKHEGKDDVLAILDEAS